ncbi:MAG: esterase-like activity of phytase family protein [Kiritimatiellae bacterium]|nr:esterase-like activity of phytase family protein [Kiritimatiellia bacterium]
MNKVGCAAMVAATAALAAFSAQAISISTAGPKLCFVQEDKNRLWDPGDHSTSYKITFPAQYKDMSGITWAGGNKFYVVQNNGFLMEMTVARDNSGNVDSLPTIVSRRTLVGAHDPEGIAYDPSTGNVWISSEENSDGSKGATICEYDPNTGYPTYRAVQIPDIIKTNVRKNLSLESLTISGDGLTMWTANEEALNGDGDTAVDLAGQSAGTKVRLIKFKRDDVHSPWTLDGMWAYVCDPVNVGHPKNGGVSDLVALPDGSLLVMERIADTVEGFLSARARGILRIYRPNFTNATDVRNKSSLSSGGIVTVAKGSRLLDMDDTVAIPGRSFDYWIACYEGICLGPRNSDGTCNLMVVSDGGAYKSAGNSPKAEVWTEPYIRSLKLSGLNVRTLNFEFNSPIGEASIVGQNYRFVNGATVNAAVYGNGLVPRAYTNRGDVVAATTWSLPNHSPSSGYGTTKTFTVTADDTLTWNVYVAGCYGQWGESAPIFMHDTFEEYAADTECDGIANWDGEGVIKAQSYTPYQGSGKYVLRKTGVNHTKVLNAEDETSRSISSVYLTNSQDTRMDMMVEIRRSQEDSLEMPSGNPKLAIAADKNGKLHLWHRKGVNGKLVSQPVWSQISDTAFNNGAWVRVSVEIKYGSSLAFARVRINGTDNLPNNSDWRSVTGGYSSAALNPGSGSGPWFPLQNKTVPSTLSVVGTKVDDFIIAVAGSMQNINQAQSIMVAPASSGAAAGGVAYSVTPVAAPAIAGATPASGAAAPEETEAKPSPVITGFMVTLERCPKIRFEGYSDKFAYRVVRSSSVDFRAGSCEYPDGQFATDGCKAGEAVWVGSEPDDPASGAKFYRIEAVEMQ